MEKTPLFTSDLAFYYALSGLLATLVLALTAVIIAHLMRIGKKTVSSLSTLIFEVALLKKGHEEFLEYKGVTDKRLETVTDRLTRQERLIVSPTSAEMLADEIVSKLQKQPVKKRR